MKTIKTINKKLINKLDQITPKTIFIEKRND